MRKLLATTSVLAFLATTGLSNQSAFAMWKEEMAGVLGGIAQQMSKRPDVEPVEGINAAVQIVERNLQQILEAFMGARGMVKDEVPPTKVFDPIFLPPEGDLNPGKMRIHMLFAEGITKCPTMRIGTAEGEIYMQVPTVGCFTPQGYLEIARRQARFERGGVSQTLVLERAEARSGAASTASGGSAASGQRQRHGEDAALVEVRAQRDDLAGQLHALRQAAGLLQQQRDVALQRAAEWEQHSLQTIAQRDDALRVAQQQLRALQSKAPAAERVTELEGQLLVATNDAAVCRGALSRWEAQVKDLQAQLDAAPKQELFVAKDRTIAELRAHADAQKQLLDAQKTRLGEEETKYQKLRLTAAEAEAAATRDILAIERQRDAARADVKRLTDALAAGGDEQARAATAALERQIAEATASATQLGTQLDTARARATQLESDAAERHAEQDRLLKNIAAAEERERALAHELAAAKAAVGAAEAQASAARGEAAQHQARAADMTEDLKGARAGVDAFVELALQLHDRGDFRDIPDVAGVLRELQGCQAALTDADTDASGKLRIRNRMYLVLSDLMNRHAAVVHAKTAELGEQLRATRDQLAYADVIIAAHTEVLKAAWAEYEVLVRAGDFAEVPDFAEADNSIRQQLAICEAPKANSFEDVLAAREGLLKGIIRMMKLGIRAKVPAATAAAAAAAAKVPAAAAAAPAGDMIARADHEFALGAARKEAAEAATAELRRSMGAQLTTSDEAKRRAEEEVAALTIERDEARQQLDAAGKSAPAAAAAGGEDARELAQLREALKATEERMIRAAAAQKEAADAQARVAALTARAEAAEAKLTAAPAAPAAAAGDAARELGEARAAGAQEASAAAAAARADLEEQLRAAREETAAARRLLDESQAAIASTARAKAEVVAAPAAPASPAAGRAAAARAAAAAANRGEALLAFLREDRGQRAKLVDKLNLVPAVREQLVSLRKALSKAKKLDKDTAQQAVDSLENTILEGSGISSTPPRPGSDASSPAKPAGDESGGEAGD